MTFDLQFSAHPPADPSWPLMLGATIAQASNGEAEMEGDPCDLGTLRGVPTIIIGVHAGSWTQEEWAVREPELAEACIALFRRVRRHEQVEALADFEAAERQLAAGKSLVEGGLAALKAGGDAAGAGRAILEGGALVLAAVRAFI